ncbi:MAG: AEC family transporter [Candidatus Thorarchaeota archaeon]
MTSLQISSDLVLNLSVFYVLILVGFLISKRTGYGKAVSVYLNPLLINLMLPLLIVSTLIGTTFNTLTESPQIVVITVMMHLAGALLLSLYLRISDIVPKKKGALLLCATFHNAVFLPIPLSLVFLGETVVPRIAVHSLTQMILLTTLGTFIGSYYNEQAIDRKTVTRKALLFPPLLATIAGFVLSILGVSLPSAADVFFSFNNTATTYLSLVVVGLALGKQFSVSHSMQALPVVTVRQVAIPLLVWVLLGFTTLTSITKSVLFIESLMPSAVLTVVYASDFRLDAQIAATVVTIGTVLLLPFLPLIPFILSFI